MKPDWKDAPEWAQWLARDDDGDYWWFESKPSTGRSIWLEGPGRVELAYSPVYWRDSLQGRPS